MKKMTLEERYAEAIRKLGGASGLLALPDPIKAILKDTTDLERKVWVFEWVAAYYGKE